jgi:hypothetical protein
VVVITIILTVIIIIMVRSHHHHALPHQLGASSCRGGGRSGYGAMMIVLHGPLELRPALARQGVRQR